MPNQYGCFFVMPAGLKRAPSVFLDSPVKPGNDKYVVLLMNFLITLISCFFIFHTSYFFIIYPILLSPSAILICTALQAGKMPAINATANAAIMSR